MYDKVCRTCGTKLSSFYKSSMLGCPNCYKAFGQEIIGALNSIQGGTFHVGKTPKLSSIDRELLNEYHNLIKERERASIEKRFDVVNQLNIEIHDLAIELEKRGLI